jgi:hypothetical protein
VTLSAEDEKDWKELFDLRVRVLPELEKARQAKLIGKSLEAKITLLGKADALTMPKRHSADFRELLNVSQLQFNETDGEVRAEVAKADGTKCESGPLRSLCGGGEASRARCLILLVRRQAFLASELLPNREQFPLSSVQHAYEEDTLPCCRWIVCRFHRSRACEDGRAAGTRPRRGVAHQSRRHAR